MKYWPTKEAALIDKLIDLQAHQGEYAVFDADNTIWHQDMEETLLAYLENKDILTRHTMDPSLQIIPFQPDDTLISYGFKLYNIDHKIGYPWFAQIFSGFTLTQLKEHADDLFARNGKVIHCKHWNKGKLVDFQQESPRIYPAQRELINALQMNGIEVYVITAALEDLIRMIVSDPKYGLNVKPENVIGLSCLLKDRKTQKVTTARKQILDGHFWDENFTKEDHYNMEITPTIWSPDTLYAGKVAAIKEYIHPLKHPVMVAGDSPSDHFMLFYSDYSKGGIKLWINHKEEDWNNTRKEYQKRAEQEKELGLDVTGDKNWIMVRPEDIGIKPKGE
ncbi:HAD family hydrolase [Desulfobacterales bacterium HSG17]|nr:HAD family hydrolase [Desulfobacterales bacterium HSG17]